MLGKNNKKIYLIYLISWFVIIYIYCKFLYKEPIVKNIYLDTKIDTLKILKYSNERNLCIFNDTIFYFKIKNKKPINIKYFNNKFNDNIDLRNINIPYKIWKTCVSNYKCQ